MPKRGITGVWVGSAGSVRRESGWPSQHHDPRIQLLRGRQAEEHGLPLQPIDPKHTLALDGTGVCASASDARTERALKLVRPTSVLFGLAGAARVCG